jgi:signal transduction histidine kinase
MPVDAFRTPLEQLHGKPDALGWPERLELCRSVGEALASGGASSSALPLVELLASDRKWEVRRAVAELLPHLAEEDYIRLGGRLKNDGNDYVRLAVKRAQEQRRKATDQSNKRRKSSDQIGHDLQGMEKEFGKAVSRRALRMSEHYSELLLGSIVHDLRTILTHLKSNSLMLIEGVHSGELSAATHRAAGKVRSDLEFLERAVRDMEAFTQPVARQRQPERLAQLLRAALEMAQVNVRSLGLDPDTVKVAIDVPESLEVRVSHYHVAMAIANVLKNSYEAVAGNHRVARIQIRAARVGDTIELTVRDNGMGMSKEEKSRLYLFVPGRRNKSKRHSTGYGLPVAMKYLGAHGGSLIVDSHEDKGTTVTIRLPVNAEGETP